MYIACTKFIAFYIAIFFNINVCFKTIGGFTFTIWAILNIISRLFVLGTIAIFVFVGAIVLCFNNTGINDTNFTASYD